MGSVNVLGVDNKASSERRISVFFTGSTALNQGVGLCFDNDRGTAANIDETRALYVEVPSTSNSTAFAGVTCQAYDAVTGGQFIEIFLPGSICQVRGTESHTIGSFYTCLVGDGAFGTVGFGGRGTFRALQTVDRSTTEGLVFGELLDGEESGLTQVVSAAVMTAGGAVAMTPTGYTEFAGGQTAASNITATLADGPYNGAKKAYFLPTAMTANDVVITVTNGIQADEATALATLTIDGTGDTSVLEFQGGNWYAILNTGSAEA